jgi:DnaJ family protein C protein 25
MNFYIYLILFLNLFIINVYSLINGLYCNRDNCYDLLNVTRTSTRQEIVKAYRTLAKKYHPDMAKTTNDKAKYTEIFRSFANAYEILKDEETRTDYDRMLDNPDQYVKIYLSINFMPFFLFIDIIHIIIGIIVIDMHQKLMFVLLYLLLYLLLVQFNIIGHFLENLFLKEK